ncbi:acyltransferase [Clostridium butyricum]
MIKINITEGSEGVNFSYLKNGYLKVSKNSKIIFNGKADFAIGTAIRVEKEGIISFGSRFNCNKNCFFACDKNIIFGNNVLLGWNVNIRDCDGHKIFKNSRMINCDKEVVIGNNVWVGANVDILKGSQIPNNCIIGYRSCITKMFYEENCVIAGYPASILQKDVNWEI